MYTHFYQLWKRVPRARRKELAKFIHRFKCLCGRKYHLHVTERLEGDIDLENDGTTHAWDNLSIDVAHVPCEQFDKLYGDIIRLMDEFGIPRKNFRHESEPFFIEEECFMVYLYTDFK